MVEEAKQNSPDVVGISSTKCRCSNTVQLDDGWKLYYPGVEPAKFTKAGLGIFERPCVDEWIPQEHRFPQFLKLANFHKSKVSLAPSRF